MFGCRHLNPDLILKLCLVVVICDHQISAYTRFSSTVVFLNTSVSLLEMTLVVRRK